MKSTFFKYLCYVTLWVLLVVASVFVLLYAAMGLMFTDALVYTNYFIGFGLSVFFFVVILAGLITYKVTYLKRDS